MGNEFAWGEALKSVGGSLLDYSKIRAQDEKDRRLADAILAKEDRARVEAIEGDKRRGLLDFLKGQEITQIGMPEQITPGLPPSAATMLPPKTGRLDLPYTQQVFAPAQEAGPVLPSRIPNIYEQFITGGQVPEDIRMQTAAKPATEGQKLETELGYAKLEHQKQRMKTKQSARADTKLNSLIRQRQNMSSPYANYTDEDRAQMDATIKSYMVESGIKLADMPRPEEAETEEEASYFGVLWSAIINAPKQAVKPKPSPKAGGKKTGSDVANSLGF